jgi:hypothetical protein
LMPSWNHRERLTDDRVGALQASSLGVQEGFWLEPRCGRETLAEAAGAQLGTWFIYESSQDSPENNPDPWVSWGLRNFEILEFDEFRELGPSRWIRKGRENASKNW